MIKMILDWLRRHGVNAGDGGGRVAWSGPARELDGVVKDVAAWRAHISAIPGVVEMPLR